MELGFIILNLLGRLPIKYGPTKKSKQWLPVIAKRKGLNAIFISGEVVAIQVPVIKDKSVTAKNYRDVVLKKLKKKIYINRNGAKSRISNMSNFYVIILHAICLLLLRDLPYTQYLTATVTHPDMD